MQRGSTTATAVIVSRSDLANARPDEVELTPRDGEAILRVDHFALTANNITYAALGEAMSYWDFFPAPAGFGRVPVWGFADVVESRCAGLAAGERVYGYFPMASHLLVAPVDIRDDQFVDGSPHRAHLPPVYNIYRRRPAGTPLEEEYFHELLSPLYTTSFLVGDFMQDNGFFGADRLLISSASSKTALGMGYYLSAAAERPREIVGLTSARNADFLRATGYFDDVVAYDALDRLGGAASVYVDFSGDGAIRERVRGTLGDGLRYDCLVGGTHWQELSGEGGGASLFNLTDQAPDTAVAGNTTFFFAPTQLDKRHADWGIAAFDRKLAASWEEFVASARQWLRFVHVRGAGPVAEDYLRVLAGEARPDEGHILSLNP